MSGAIKEGWDANASQPLPFNQPSNHSCRYHHNSRLVLRIRAMLTFTEVNYVKSREADDFAFK
jgi:hypothetical protein